MAPQPRRRQRRRRFGLFPVRSPLLGESRLLSFPGVTEMFHFTPFASASYKPTTKEGASDADDAAFAAPGYPIRRSRDLGLLGGSPGLIAAFHVRHRLLAPRHPPCTLGSLTLDMPYLGDSRQRFTRRRFSYSTFKEQCPYTVPTLIALEATVRATPLRGPDSIRPCGPYPSRRHSISYRMLSGGDDRNRTGNLWLAKPALSRLSYIPFKNAGAAASLRRLSSAAGFSLQTGPLQAPEQI